MSGQKYKPSRPFSNNREYCFFDGNFCCRCVKYKIGDEGIETPDNCPVENAISRAQFDESEWPGNDIVEVGDYSHICLRFLSDDEDLMRRYRALFESVCGEVAVTVDD